MKDSVTYQEIVKEGFVLGKAEGKAEAAKDLFEIVLASGTQRWGEPDEPVRSKLEAITDFGRLKQLTIRLITAASWEELLSGNAGPRNGSNGEQ